MGNQDKVTRGFATSVSPLVADLLKADSRELPPALTSVGEHPVSQVPVSFDRYFEPDFARLEKERLWKKSWQFACREEDIPNVGDRVPYTVGSQSFMIVRSGENEFRAFYNSCLHRGTRLCDGQSSGERVRCPFHAWEWNLDGSLHNIPSAWDFPQVQAERYTLPQVKLATWGGFIFINPDPQAAPLEQSLGVLPEHFKAWGPEAHFTAIHVSKRVRANWKTVMEAFLEAYHVIETHTDAMPFTGDASTQYDIWDSGSSHISRLYTPLGVPSPHLGEQASTQEAVDWTFRAFAMGMDPSIPVPTFDASSTQSGRTQIAEWRRQMFAAAFGCDLSKWPDAFLVDTIQYHMFPNFCPWLGDGLPLVYQFLPLGDNPDESVMNVRLMAPVPASGPRPPSAPVIEIDFDSAFSSVPQFGVLSHIFDQDMINLPKIQLGLKAASTDRAQATLGRYQESRIRYFHDVLDKVLGIAR